MNYKVIICVLMMSIVNCSYLAAQEFIDLDSLIKEVLENNPKIEAMKELWIAEEEMIGQAASLPDPVFTYGFFGKNIETRVGPQKESFAISQKIPFPGKLSLKAKAQNKQAKAAYEAYVAVAREIVKDVKLTFYDLYWIDRTLEITQVEKGLLEDAANSLQLKYEANLKPQRDVLKVEVEISKLLDKLLILRQQRAGLIFKLNSLLDRSIVAELGKVREIKLGDINLDSAELQNIFSANRQEINILRHKVEKSKFDKILAKFNFLPDFILGFKYINVEAGHTTQANDGEDAWIALFSVTLPIWQARLQANLKEKEARLQASINNLENEENNAAYEVNDLYLKVTTYRDIVNLYDTALIPQANQAYESTKTSYEAGRTDFLDWLDSERTLLKLNLAYYKTKADYAKTLALLERALGKDL